MKTYNQNVSVKSSTHFATYGDNDLVEIFLKNDDFVKNAYSIESTAVQIAYRKTVMEATDSSGNIIKKNDEIIEAI